MLKVQFAAILLASLLLLTGCAPKDDFEDYELEESQPIEDASARTEFTEYDGNVEEIVVYITNDRDKRLQIQYSFRIQKLVDGEWKLIRDISPDEPITPLAHFMPERCTAPIAYKLKDHVKLPLLPGQYRILVGTNTGTGLSAEFTIK